MSYVYPDVRDQRRIANSDAKTLLQNWVEERAVEHYDKIPHDYSDPNVKYFHGGHKGLITIKGSNPMNGASTYADNYIAPELPNDDEAKGIRYKLTEQMLTRKLIAQMEEDENLKNDWCDEPTNFVSETQEKYNRPEFVSRKPAPTAKHDLYSEMPVSYWTEKRKVATGVSQMKVLDTAFRKNTSFSKPISETYDTAQPYDLENYPYMSQQSNNNGPLM